MNDQYSDLYQSYQWSVPSHFNIATACMHRWAESPHEGRRIALFHEDEAGQRQTWSYSRLSETASQLANGLIKMGVAPGDRVAVIMGQRPETIVAYIAILSVGAIILPLSASINADGLSARLRNAEARVAVVDAATRHALLEAQPQCPALTQIIGLGFQHDYAIAWRTLLARQPSSFKAFPTRAESPAILLYTAGTTGTPKGVLLAHRSLIGALPGFVASQNWFPQKSDIFWTAVDWACPDALLNALLPTLYFGRAIVGTLGPFSSMRAFEIMERYQVTNAFLRPASLKAMIKETTCPRKQYQLALRCIMTTGEGAGKTLSRWCEESLGVPVNVTFGQIEVNCVIGNSSLKWPSRPGSIGRPFPGHRVAVLDTDGRPCAANAAGDIAVHQYDGHGHADPVLFLGYWHDDEATRAKFSGEWCLTGDMATVDDDGYYWYMGRKDDIFQSAGERIIPLEIEDCLTAHDAVASAAVIGKPDRNGNAIIKAYVVLAAPYLESDPKALAATLQEQVRANLAPAQMPAEIEFVEKLPLTATGNVRRQVLRTREMQLRHRRIPSAGR